MYPYYVIKFNNPPGRYYKGPLITSKVKLQKYYNAKGKRDRMLDSEVEEITILHQTHLYENHIHRRQAKRYATKEIAQAVINDFPKSFVNCSVEEITSL